MSDGNKMELMADEGFEGLDKSWFVIGRQGCPCVICEDGNGNLMAFEKPNEAQKMIDINMAELGLMNVMYISKSMTFERIKIKGVLMEDVKRIDLNG